MDVRATMRAWSLLRRIRALFLAYAIVSLAAPAYHVGTAAWPPGWMKAVVLTGVVALVPLWLLSWRWQRFPVWTEPLEWLVPAGVLYVADNVGVGSGMVFTIMLYRTLFGGVGDAVLRIFYMEAVLVVPAAVRGHHDPGFEPVDPALLVAVAMMTLVMVVLKTALSQHEQLATRERVLARGATAMARATDRESIYGIAVRTALGLAGDGPGIRTTMSGDGAPAVVLAAAGDDVDGLVGMEVRFDLLPTAAGDTLRGGEPVYLDRAECAALRPLTGVPISPGGVLMVPLRSGGHRLGTLTVGSRRSLHSEIRSSLVTWAAQVASSLESLMLNEELTRRAFHDPLTDLPNRALVRDRLRLALAGSSAERQAALMIIDLDGFKQVNDVFGHKAGDELLCQIAIRLTECVRQGDTVGRLGGDEFAVVLPDVPDPQVARRIAERMVDAARTPITADGHVVKVGASIGIAFAAGPGGDIDDLSRAADAAMYQAKAGGVGGIAVHEDVVRAG